MGQCESLCFRVSKKDNLEKEEIYSSTLKKKHSEGSQASHALTKCSSSMNPAEYSNGSQEPHVYHCNHNSYRISIEKLKGCQLLPCKCIKRQDVSLDIFESEAINNPTKSSICSKHGIQCDVYCFECEIKLCPKCNGCFHDEYFCNHHMFLLN